MLSRSAGTTPAHQPDSASTSEPDPWVEELARRHQAGVWRYLRLLGCAPDLADDLVQETFLQVLRRPFVDALPHAPHPTFPHGQGAPAALALP